MSIESDHHYACDLAEFLDSALEKEWTPTIGVLALTVPNEAGELDVEFRSFAGHPADFLPTVARREGCVAAALSVLGHARPMDKPSGRRRRIRSTVAVDATGDVSLIRYKDGTVDRLHRVTGLLADMLYSLLDTRLAPIVPLPGRQR